MSEDPLVGTLIADRYRIVQKLGEGGMGIVYKAVHEALRKPVALKLLSSGGRLDREAVARFEREAVAAANLRHPNIAEATDFGKLPDGALYLVMEYVEGTTLRHVLHKERKLPPERALHILSQVGSALATAHARDVVHRDLKPENIIVTSGLSVTGASGPGPTDFVKVIDFGIAKIRNATFGIGGGATAALTRAGMVFGTPEYMAPEQVMGQAVDARADQYALGVMAFELLTGKPPFSADDMGQLMMMHVGAPVPSTRESTPALPPAADAVVMKMLAKLPDERFPSVSDAMAALAAGLGAAAATSSAGAGSGAGAGASSNAQSAHPGSPGSGPASGGATLRIGPPVSSPSIAQAVTPPTLRSVAVDSPAQQGPSSARTSGARASAGAYAPGTTGAHSGAQVPTGAMYAPGTTGAHPMAAPGALPHSLRTKAYRPSSGMSRGRILAIVIGAVSLLGGVIVTALAVRSCGDGGLPSEVTAALADWKGGKPEAAAAAIRKAVTEDPEIAQDIVLATTLAESVGKDPARRALAGLLETTALGRSRAMASALAASAVKDDPKVRDSALELLRDRHDLLSREHAARVRLRDADDCEQLNAAMAEVIEIGTPATQRDVERMNNGDCKRMLRDDDVCGDCRGGPGGPGRGIGPGKKKGKGKRR